MVELFRGNVTDKATLLECFKVWYEDSLVELEDRLINRNITKKNIEEELDKFLNELDTDDFDLMWTLLELKFLKIGLQGFSTNLGEDVLDTIINNALDEDKDIVMSHKDIMISLFANQELVFLDIKPIIFGVLDGKENKIIDSSIPVQKLYRGYIKDVQKILEPYEKNISNKSLEDLTDYPIDMVTKYINKTELVINKMLMDFIPFYSEVYSLAIDETIKNMEGVEETKMELANYYVSSVIEAYFKKINKITKLNMINEISEHFIYVMDNLEKCLINED